MFSGSNILASIVAIDSRVKKKEEKKKKINIATKLGYDWKVEVYVSYLFPPTFNVTHSDVPEKDGTRGASSVNWRGYFVALLELE